MTRRWLVAGAAVLALAGCGDSGTDPADAPPPAAASTTAGAPADEPNAGTTGTGGTNSGGTGTGGTAPGTEGSGDRPTGDGPAGTDPDAFVAAVRDRLPDVAADRRDEEIGDVARQACAGLAAGDAADRIVAATRSLGTLDAEATDHATARELIKLAIDTVCPGQARRVDEF